MVFVAGISINLKIVFKNTKKKKLEKYYNWEQIWINIK